MRTENRWYLSSLVSYFLLYFVYLIFCFKPFYFYMFVHILLGKDS